MYGSVLHVLGGKLGIVSLVHRTLLLEICQICKHSSVKKKDTKMSIRVWVSQCYCQFCKQKSMQFWKFIAVAWKPLKLVNMSRSRSIRDINQSFEQWYKNFKFYDCGMKIKEVGQKVKVQKYCSNLEEIMHVWLFLNFIEWLEE